MIADMNMMNSNVCNFYLKYTDPSDRHPFQSGLESTGDIGDDESSSEDGEISDRDQIVEDAEEEPATVSPNLKNSKNRKNKKTKPAQTLKRPPPPYGRGLIRS